MTSQEREQILKMVAEGKITAEEGLKLMQALEQLPPEEAEAAEESAEEVGAGAEWQAERSGLEAEPRIARVKATARRLWQIPLWIGVAVVLLSAWGMYALLQGPGMNFWFFCLILPLLLGVLLMAAAVGSRKARWIFVDVHQKPGEKPARIFLGFPLPLKLISWFFRTFGHKIDDLKDAQVDAAVQILETGFSGEEPLVVNVDEGEDGERVRVYIG
ncbi:MAG: hypothetical protein ABWK53_02530 [Anaerolineales bacterium]